MKIKVLFREYNYPSNVVSGTQGSALLSGIGTKFTEIPVGTPLEIEGVGFAGCVASVSSDTLLQLDRTLNQTFAQAVFWQDWSGYLISISPLSRKVESDNPGEAGVIVFDDTTLELFFGESLVVDGQTIYNPVPLAFGGDIDSKKRYLIRLQAVKWDYNSTDSNLITNSYNRIVDNLSRYLSARYKAAQAYTVYEGIIDFSTIVFPVYKDYDGEYIRSISFDLIDKLGALNTLRTTVMRESGYLNPDVAGSDIGRVAYYKYQNRSDFYIMYYHDDSSPRDVYDSNSPDVGDVMSENFLYGEAASSANLLLITFKYLDTIMTNNRMFYDCITNNKDWYASSTDQDNTGTNDGVRRNANAQKWFKKLFANKDIYVYETMTRSFKKYDGTFEVTGTGIVALDAIKLIEALVTQRWPDITLKTVLRDQSGNAIDEYRLPLNFIFQLLDEFPFGKEPIEALSYVANAINCYVYIDSSGNLVLQNTTSLIQASASPALPAVAFPDRLADMMTKKYFWDKLVDAVEITAQSWIYDTTAKEYLEGEGAAYKVTGIRPRNKLTKDLVVDRLSLDRFGFAINTDGTLSYAGLTTQQEMLNKYAELRAQEYLDFYGKRHLSYDVSINKLTWDLIQWDMLTLIDYNGAKYFVTNLDYDFSGNTLQFSMVSVDSWAYNLDNVIIGKMEDRI